MSCSSGIADPFSIMFVPIPYFSISIHLCNPHDLETAVHPNQSTTEGQQEDSVMGPRAPVCWLTTHTSVKAMFARSSSILFSIWWRMATLFAVFAVCQFTRSSPYRFLGAPVESRGSVDATWAVWRATSRDLPMGSVIPAPEMVVNCRQ